jgi:hypothetical protein
VSKLNRPDSPEKHTADLSYLWEDRYLSVDEGKITLSHRVLVIRIPLLFAVLALVLIAAIIVAILSGNPEIVIDVLRHLPVV